MRLSVLLALALVGGLLWQSPFVCARQISRQIFTYTDKQDAAARLGVTGSSGYIMTATGSNRGLYITSVSNRSVASRIGLESGDMLLQLDSRSVPTARDADRILESVPSGTLKAVFVRQTSSNLSCYNQAISYENRANSGVNDMIVSSPSSIDKIQSSVPVSVLESYMHEIVNADRAADGKGHVSLSSSLSNVARKHSEDMIKRQFFAHVNPDGANPRDRAAAAGLNISCAENIATKNGPMSPQKKVAGCQALMMSEPRDDPHNHRGNILNPKWTAVGIGCAYGPTGAVYVTQEFTADSVP